MNKNLITAPLILFLIALALRALDVFVFRLDELLGEIILSKSLGFILVAAYVWFAGRKPRDIGFHSDALGKSLLIGGLTVGGLFTLSYGSQLIAFALSGQPVQLVFSAIDPKTGMVGGQDVFHFHLHIVPRFSGDKIVFRWNNTPVEAERLSRLAAEIRAELGESG